VKNWLYGGIAHSGLFDREYYLRNNLEVAKDCINPLKHYLRAGWRQGQNPNPYFDTAWYLQKYPDAAKADINPLSHYLSRGWKMGYDPSPHFSVKGYLKQHPELADHGSEPLSHFINHQEAALEEIDFGRLPNKASSMDDFGKVAIHAHVYYTDLVPEFVKCINHVPGNFDCFFTTDTEAKKQTIQNEINGSLNAQTVEIRITPNIGRDIAPFVVGCRDILVDYDFVCHIHTKKALHTSENDYGNTWRKDLLGSLLGSQEQVQLILSYFKDHQDVGLLCPKNFIPIQKYLEFDINQWNMEYLAERMGLSAGPPRKIVCPAGSMFWSRTTALRNLVDAEFSYSEFDGEAGQLDGTLAHAFERLFVYIAKDNGFSSCIIGSKLN
jgi:lipopolysaccharide biosynthesis protein